MSYNGFEIDMLSVGNADCLLTTRWNQGQPNRVLIDGGRTETTDKVKVSLLQRNVYHIDHLVCTHPHEDHVGGLVGLVNSNDFTIGRAWMHLPWQHVNLTALTAALSATSSLSASQTVQKTLQGASKLHDALQTANVPISEPFVGEFVDSLLVCGPSQSFYEELLVQFSNADTIAVLQRNVESSDQLLELSEQLYKSSSKSLLDNPQTTPENNSSAILATFYDNCKYLFTADAGVQALTRATTAYSLDNCHWMQIPHHRSRRNINTTLIQHFNPNVAYVSAVGNAKHPRRAVVNAFKEMGADVYSTHYPNGGDLWHHRGDVPTRPGYYSATPMWDAES